MASSFLGLVYHLPFTETPHFGSRFCFCFQVKDQLTWCTPYMKLFSVSGQP